jgi:hypothetical protein
MAYSLETEGMLGRAAQRMHAVIHAALRESDVTRREYLDAVDVTTSDVELDLRVGDLYRVLLKTRAGQFAAVLPGEFDTVFWVELKRNLMRSTSCDFSDFGRLRLWDSRVEFHPAPVLLIQRTPAAPTDGQGVHEVASRACETTLLPNVYLLSRAAFTTWDQFAEQLLERSLHGLAEQINRDRAGLPGTMLLRTHAFALAYATYWSMVIGFGRLLEASLPVAIPLIGSFRREAQTVVFEPAPEFLRLLDANTPVVS